MTNSAEQSPSSEADNSLASKHKFRQSLKPPYSGSRTMAIILRNMKSVRVFIHYHLIFMFMLASISCIRLQLISSFQNFRFIICLFTTCYLTYYLYIYIYSVWNIYIPIPQVFPRISILTAPSEQHNIIDSNS